MEVQQKNSVEVIPLFGSLAQWIRAFRYGREDVGVRVPQESQHTCQWCNGSIKISKIFGGGSSPSWCAKYRSGEKVAAPVLDTGVLKNVKVRILSSVQK